MNRRNLWIAAGVLVMGVIFWAVGQAVNPSRADEEFQRTLDAMKQVKSFRGSYIQTGSGTHSERLWEVDCNRVMVHQQSHDAQSNSDSPFEIKEEDLLVGDQRYSRDGNGSWESNGYAGDRYSAKWYCNNIARGEPTDLLPDMLTMLRHSMAEPGGKKTVNGVRCREWKFATRTALSAQGGSVCLGVDDHLPYEMTTQDGASTFSYSDYNKPVPIDAPEGVVQPASSTSEAN